MKQTNKLWQNQTALLPLIEEYTVGNDHEIDQKLLPYDVLASKAHAAMLVKTGVLTTSENDKLQAGLDRVLEKWQKGDFKVTREQEDVHTALENYLTTKYGEIGKKIHTGRSRNDQALVMIRLYLIEQLETIADSMSKLSATLLDKAEQNAQVPMPGYTHTQKAMPTTVGLWLASFAAGFQDSEGFINSTAKLLDQNPLGSASGFGVESAVVDRNFTTKALGFARTQENPLYCGLSRGMFEGVTLQTLAMPMQLCGRFAADMMLFTMQEFGYFSLPASFTTGSSIMPQKRNYDLFEIMRANVRAYLSKASEIQQIVAGLISGYNRDVQITKRLVVEGIELCVQTIAVTESVVQQMHVHEDVLKTAMTSDLFATARVYKLVEQGMPFRDAYLKIKQELGV
ncbi:MAG: argininosuccinate lyase [Patescibacteria group bacterium]